MDQYFRVEVIAQTPNPQQLVWLSAHQCVCEGAAIDDKVPEESKAGEYVIKHLLAGDRGHYSPLEAPQISFNVIGFNHRTMQQITRHRIGMHFSVQSFRYTSDRFLTVARLIQNTSGAVNPSMDQVSQTVLASQPVQAAIEQLIYLRPVGDYRDRQGKKYHYDHAERLGDLALCAHQILRYAHKIERGYSEEQAAGLLPMDCRQHWVMSANIRSLMHMLDLRWKADAQLECQVLCDLLWVHFENWAPEIAAWYQSNRAHKARLAP